MVFSREDLWKIGGQQLREITLDKMSDSVAAVKVIFVIRRQGDILPSLYAQTAHARMEAKFEDYVESIFNSNKLPANITYEIVDSFINAFGNDAVHVTPMEALFDPANKDARHRLALFMGGKPKALEAAFNAAEPANKRAASNGQKVTYEVASRLTYSGRAMQSAWNKTKYFLGPIRNKSWLKSLRQRFLRHCLTRPIQDFQVTQERKAELTAAFAESNWRLAKKCGLEQELQRYGYFPNPTNGDTEEKIEAD
ncbi:MAG: hypothetical protein BRC59_01570 [Cyanobacteria bacterium SW_4_48_29]|nr:MAG: hypothetical protein BRC59_01570 [Cyanobacteria bacterium SW_4_48_29]